MLSCPVDISLLELLTECPDDGGEMWILIINMLKGGDERPHGCGGLSRSRRLIASSPLRSQDRACNHAWGIWSPRRPTNLWRTSRGSSSLAFHLRVR